ncbi:molybdate ABC transporter permease subunit [Pontibacillus yanchengensis]|uniref:Molybdate ABC transporter permease subunit n=2 Tax=Pontibacillus yanchengensis TaxID=462910 RepID=A0ACC7VBL9_9BACI|nr:molybdate ABC transporter permease subunit [Pontibacillus yanchengensis]MYL34684.1 molybdate ABC transporter permease subunit [Pontibacillus yanchengensis]MYL52331.1 molybdate ABC transporter permease subunit [Pontibacillus yanchengensis]
MYEQFWSPIQLSIVVASIATLLVVFIGTLLGKRLSSATFKGKVFIDTALLLPIVLPPSVIGFMLIVFFGENSLVGRGINILFNQSILFTSTAAVIAASVVAFPLMYQSAKVGFRQINHDIEQAARVDGANEFQVFGRVSLPLAKQALVTGGLLSFTRAFGEFGATLMFAGNIPGKTQTIPTAIYVAMESGEMRTAWLYVAISIFLSFLLLTLTYVIQPESD